MLDLAVPAILLLLLATAPSVEAASKYRHIPKYGNKIDYVTVNGEDHCYYKKDLKNRIRCPLSRQQIDGIIIGSIVAFVVLLIIAACVYVKVRDRRRKRRTAKKQFILGSTAVVTDDAPSRPGELDEKNPSLSPKVKEGKKEKINKKAYQKLEDVDAEV